MKKKKKILICIIIVLLIIIIIDCIKIKNNQKPILCIITKIYRDGGTKEYYGLGYKVIVFNTVGGYNEVKIGPWSMKYEDFNDEMKNYKKVIITNENDDRENND